MRYTVPFLLAAASALALPNPDYAQLPASSNHSSPKNETWRSTPTTLSSLYSKPLTYKASSLSVPTAGSCGKDGLYTVTVTKTQIANTASPSVGQPVSSSAYKSGSYAAGISAPIEHTGPVETLQAVVHWNVDTTPPQNVIPIASGNSFPQYYAQSANTDPQRAHMFGTMTYYFKSPAVNLDYADHAKSVTYAGSNLIIGFGSQLAFTFAKQSWTVGMILNTHTTDCGGEAGKGCYWTVTGLDFQADSMSVVCSGSSSQIEDIIHSGEAEWGVYEPKRDGNGGFSGFGSPTGPANYNTGPSAGPGTGSSSGFSNSTFSSNSSAAQSFDSFSPNTTVCQSPKDTKFGLPTACLGNLFDLELDTRLGFDQSNLTEFQQWLSATAPGADDGDIEDPSLTARSIAMNMRRSLLKRFCFSCFVPPFIQRAASTAVQLYQDGKQAIASATSITGDFTTNMPLQVPNNSPPKDGKVIDSPWGNSILLKAFGTQPSPDATTPSTGYLNIFCVDCGAKGNAQLTGKAAFSPLAGFTRGEVGMTVDLDVVLKLGIDAQLQFTKEFTNTLFELGLPGLEFGVVKIGPMVSLGTAVTFEAAAKGRVLAGAEFGLKKAQVTLDFISPSKSSQSGWTPYFQPIFQADGEIMLAAELGLLIGLKCGIKVLSFSKSVGVFDQPSIKAQAEVAANAGLTGAGTLSAGFKSSNGCTGISTQVHWRNRIWVDVLDLQTFNIHDSGYTALAQGCIDLPGVPAGVPTDPTVTTPDAPATTIFDDQAAADLIFATEDAPTTVVEDPAQTTGFEQAAFDPAAATAVSIAKRSTNSLDFPKLVYRHDKVARQISNLTIAQPSTNATGPVLDLTSLVVSSVSTIQFPDQDIKAEPYNRTDGYEFVRMISQDLQFLITSCSNGNIYMQGINETTPNECSDLWAALADVTSTDGSSRIIHYYQNTMDAVGVSRMRVSSEDQLPVTAVPIALTPFDVSGDPGASTLVDLAAIASSATSTPPVKRQLSPPASNSTATLVSSNSTTASPNDADVVDNTLYFATDMFDNIFFTAICTYLDHQMPRMFLVNDTDVGITMLQSPDVEFSITGGLVDKCFLLPLIQGNDNPDQFDGLDGTSAGDTVNADLGPGVAVDAVSESTGFV